MGKNIGFIGCGNMAASIVSGAIHSKQVEAKNVWMSYRDTPTSKEKMQNLKNQFPEINFTLDSTEVVENSRTVFLAVKPIAMESAVTSIAKIAKDKPQTVFVSVAAGITTEAIGTWLNNASAAVVRTMPNTPAAVKEGATAVFNNNKVTPETAKEIQQLFSEIGEVAIITDETKMDVTTAISGSGPAYFFYTMNVLQQRARSYSKEPDHISKQEIINGVKAAINAFNNLNEKFSAPLPAYAAPQVFLALIQQLYHNAKRLGLSEEAAKTLATQTALGAAELANQNQNDFATLQKNVTSKGGTTEAAINMFTKNDLDKTINESIIGIYHEIEQLKGSNFAEIITNGVNAAHQRGQEMAKDYFNKKSEKNEIDISQQVLANTPNSFSPQQQNGSYIGNNHNGISLQNGSHSKNIHNSTSNGKDTKMENH